MALEEASQATAAAMDYGFKFDCELMELPPGFRFHPTDEEIITHYLTPKVVDSRFTAKAIGDADLNKCEPWDLPKKAKMGEKEWYFFCRKDRKYPTGTRTNRATVSGYWKATGKDKEIYRGKGCLVGMKKTLVFYRGRAPKGDKTNWVMHEYRLEGNFIPKPLVKDEWAVCRVFHKNTPTAGGIKRSPVINGSNTLSRMNSFAFVDDLFLLSSSPPPPPLMDPPDSNNASTLGGGEDRLTATASSSQPVPKPFDQYFSFLMNQKYDNDNNGDGCTSFQAVLNPPNHPSNPPFPSLQNPLLDFPSRAAHPTPYPPAGAYSRGGHPGVEQLSSDQRSMVTVSQETGHSTDINTEISSIVFKHGDDEDDGGGGGDDMGNDNSHRSFEDLECLWNY